VEEEATAVQKQRVANKTDYQAVAGVLMSLQSPEASKSKRAAMARHKRSQCSSSRRGEAQGGSRIQTNTLDDS